MTTLTTDVAIDRLLEQLQISDIRSGACTGTHWLESDGELLTSFSPADGRPIASVRQATAANYEHIIRQAQEAFRQWRKIPAPKRGDIVRQMGEAIRQYKEPLAQLVSVEMGKIYQEGLGEVQEIIDICDFATGLSRQLYGLTMHSERPQHRMYEQWHPLGPVAVITAFNFPVAVWSWNAMIALVCGDVVVWKPSSKTPLCAIAVHRLLAPVLRRNNVPEGVLNLIVAGSSLLGDRLLADKRLPLVSFTGSTRMGRQVARTVGERLGRCLLELGGNNAIIITEHTNMDLALRAVLFGAIGTTGQRCTSTRRLIIHETIYEEFKSRLIKAYESIPIGHPLGPDTLMGPLVDTDAVSAFQHAMARVKAEGGRIIYGGETLTGNDYPGGCYVRPCLAEVSHNLPVVCEETFAPLLYLMSYRTLDQAIELQNGVPQGLSSAIFTNHLREAEHFLSHEGSDCGIANVNIGTSGAEIGGAFGGEKDTGGGREAGSDAWKNYMRRQTTTINYSSELPLAQGIRFEL
jgi:aldehyde dehydrogenase (NAD+)